MTKTRLVTVAVEAEYETPTEQQIADAIADIPTLEGKVSVLNSITINGAITKNTTK